MPGESVQLHGWTISTNKAPILGSRDLEEVNAALGGVINLPEQLYGHSWVDFHHAASGTAISFNALDALRGWCQEALPPLRVAGAQDWMRTRRREVEASQAEYLDYDWTFTSPYCGTTCSADSAGATPAQRAFCLAGHGDAGAQWSATEHQIDRQMLMARDPLLLYDEVLLYESELDDSGVSNYSVKVRVMERCFFCLARFFLRVDSTMVRLREVRLFCRFDQPHVVLRELTHREGTMAELAAGGAPPAGAAYQDADTAGVALQAVAPVAVKLFITEKLELQASSS